LGDSETGGFFVWEEISTCDLSAMPLQSEPSQEFHIDDFGVVFSYQFPEERLALLLKLVLALLRIEGSSALSSPLPDG